MSGLPPDFGFLVLGAVVAGFVQGLSGFAFGMVAMSFWVWTIDPRTAAVMTVFGALTGQIVAAMSVRRAFRLEVLWPFLLGGLLGVPVGVAVLPSLDPVLFKFVLGVFFGGVVPSNALVRSLPSYPEGRQVC